MKYFLPADLCLWCILHPESFVLKWWSEEVFTNIDSSELCGVEYVGDSDTLEILLLLDSGSVTKNYAREHLVTVNTMSTNIQHNKKKIKKKDVNFFWIYYFICQLSLKYLS